MKQSNRVKQYALLIAIVSLLVSCKQEGKKEKAEATLKALKDRYSEWCRQALTNSSKVKKRTALIQEDLDKVIAEWQSSSVIK